MNSKELIGKRFKRNKYGPSIWDDIIVETRIDLLLIVKPYKLIDEHFKTWNEHVKEYSKQGFTLEFLVKGTKSNNWYNINEIIIFAHEN